ncbi:MAG: DNA methylase [Bacteroidetes bacterium ADurb.Bin408]|nr:MAG: DNA methylase [Bacteroidetes bacterium ADurb.Bin408]
MGSGTTAIAAIMNERNYIGIELSPEYTNMAENRIKAFNKQCQIKFEPQKI